ncbi:monovalent cation/H+ antiporter complex subunit F [Candidatus Omnitrophota bacterium]
MNKRLQWVIGVLVLIIVMSVIIISPLPILLCPDLPCIPLFRRAFFILLLSSLLCLYRIFRGPTAADRAVAIDILGILILGFCAILSIPTGRSWYLDVGIAWGLQSFIATIALTKFLEGRDFDD